MRVTKTEAHRAAKAHRCQWCSTWIDVGATYQRYRFYNRLEANTVKMHPECYSAMQEAAQDEGGWLEWSPGDNPRGCNCRHDPECWQCLPAEQTGLSATGRAGQPAAPAQTQSHCRRNHDEQSNAHGTGANLATGKR